MPSKKPLVIPAFFAINAAQPKGKAMQTQPELPTINQKIDLPYPALLRVYDGTYAAMGNALLLKLELK